MATYLTLFFCFIIFSQNCPRLKEAAVSPHGPFSLPEILPTVTNFPLSQVPSASFLAMAGVRVGSVIGSLLVRLSKQPL